MKAFGCCHLPSSAGTSRPSRGLPADSMPYRGPAEIAADDRPLDRSSNWSACRPWPAPSGPATTEFRSAVSAPLIRHGVGIGRAHSDAASWF